MNYIEETSGRTEIYTTREVKTIYEICDISGWPYPMNLSYTIIEETREITECKVEFHFGCSSSAFDSTEEVAKEYVQEMEGEVDWLCQIEIE